jgi:hypothetical protein
MSGDATEHRDLKATDMRMVEALIDEHFPFDRDVIRIESDTWAIHGPIPVNGNVILAEFETREDAEVALELLWTAEQRTTDRG